MGCTRLRFVRWSAIRAAVLQELALFFVALAILSWRVRGAVWALCAGWLVATVPVALGFIKYETLQDRGGMVTLALAGFSLVFAVGAMLGHAARGSERIAPDELQPAWAAEFRRWLTWARLIWVLAIIGTAFLVIDYAVNGRQGLSDLAALRDQIVGMKSASTYAQLAAVLTWSGLYCYIFALLFWRELTPAGRIWFSLPVVGYFLVSVLSAGRNAAFQIMLVTVTCVLLDGARRRNLLRVAKLRLRLTAVTTVIVPAISALMVAYMGYVAVARNNDAVSDDKTEVLAAIFSFNLAAPIEHLDKTVNRDVRGAVVEGLVYFTSTTMGYESFLRINWPHATLGVYTFPFALRQTNAITGLNPAEALDDKAARLAAVGGFAYGWTTAYSHYQTDFTDVGAAVLLALGGFWSGWSWRRAVEGASFNGCVLGIMLIVSALYTPLVPAVSDTNVFLVLVAGVMLPFVDRLLRRDAAGAAYVGLPSAA